MYATAGGRSAVKICCSPFLQNALADPRTFPPGNGTHAHKGPEELMSKNGPQSEGSTTKRGVEHAQAELGGRGHQSNTPSPRGTGPSTRRRKDTDSSGVLLCFVNRHARKGYHANMGNVSDQPAASQGRTHEHFQGSWHHFLLQYSLYCSRLVPGPFSLLYN